MNSYRKLIAVGIVGATLLMGSPAFAIGALDWKTAIKADKCGGVGAPIINISEGILNDSDSGVAGNYWAFDAFTRSIEVWKTSTAGVYCASVIYHGTFQAVAGQTAPAGTSTLSGHENGSIQGGYLALITGTLLAHPAWATSGSVGTVNYACDINGNCPGAVDWIAKYFNYNSNTGFNFNWWGWEYDGAQYGTWINSIDGNSGNIT